MNTCLLGPNQRSRRQHYTPEFLLRSFANGDQIEVYDLDSDVALPVTSVSNAGLATRFYDMTRDGISLSLEAWLSEVESQVAPIILRLDKDARALTELTEREMLWVARFICVQDNRSPSQRSLEFAMRRQIVDHHKEAMRSVWSRTYGPEEGRLVWEALANEPDEWWLGENEPYQPVKTTIALMDSVPGLANVLQAMPWRIGMTSGEIYTSDSPIAKLPRGENRWSVFFQNIFFVPISRNVLLKIGPGLAPEDQLPNITVRDFSAWETSFARHAITQTAIRFLFGPGPHVPRQCAESCLSRLGKTPAVRRTRAF